ncbi:hypothetical protein [Prosthecodimorpha staleyi]|uniref:Uncharacterized protein n=1 Tax=Prosthecodimorpha staleyi TaxID=2840188 RepID=A0A947D5N2_9HYPH|nr:hypothetical protein [Prosthecodimorpha staleyi]MBT9288642.1 hypothetical protein [Prosthecodimorpha staleyi]
MIRPGVAALLAALVLSAPPALALDPAAVFSNPDFQAVDLDAFIAGRNAVWFRNGPTFFRPLDPVVVMGTLKRPPFLWPAGAPYYDASVRLNEIPTPPPARYGLEVRSRAGRTVIFHLQDMTAASIMAEIARDGAQCCIGKPVRIWARSAYVTKDGRHGFMAIGVATHAK